MRVRPIRILLVLLVVLVATSPGEVRARGGGGVASTGQVADRGTVVLLHGLGRTHRSMTRVEDALIRRGYRVVNLGYPSRDATWGQLVDSVATAVDSCCRGEAGPVHFVTHSMGGILVRAYLEDHALPALGRVVMLSPPNQGTEVVDRIPEELLTLLLGPASVLLGTDSASVPLQLGPADFELGVITGDVSINRLFSLWLPGDDDGTVAVGSAWVEGTDAFLVVPYTHTFIMRREEVIIQILAFLETGRFVDARPVP
jgi:triacylglycerol lipase